MRFLHTADWHVGKTLRGRSRADEHEAALAEILAIARDAQVDAVLIGGDTFDSQMPAPDAERLVYAFLAECCGAGIPVVMIGGNHDHPRKLAALTRLLDRLRIYVRPEVARPADGGVIELRARDGREEARIAVLPFVPERRIVDAAQLLAPEEQWYQTYADRLARMLEGLAAGFSTRTVNLVLAHLLVDGARVGGGERELHLGQVYALTPQRLPAGAHYIGLGHLHRPQRVGAASWTEYAGSILQLDFGEVDQGKRVVVVEAHPGRPVDVRSVPLAAGRRLLDVTGTLDELRTRAAELRGAFLRVTVNIPAPEPGIADRVRELLPDAIHVIPRHPTLDRVPGPDPPPADLQPVELLREFHRRRRRAELPAAMAQLFERLYAEALDAAP
jgi:exonuclease SbcD